MYLLEGLYSTFRTYKVAAKYQIENPKTLILNSRSRMYLLEGLDSVFRTYKVGAGDVLTFGRLPSARMCVSARKPGPGDVQRTRRSANATANGDRPAKVPLNFLQERVEIRQLCGKWQRCLSVGRRAAHSPLRQRDRQL